MDEFVVKFRPSSSFREEVPSHTLFGAICWRYLELFGEDELVALLSSFRTGNPNFVVSSVFPYINSDDNDDDLLFFPKPIRELSRGNAGLPKQKYGFEKLKNFKKIEWVSETVFSKILNGLGEEEVFAAACSDDDGAGIKGSFRIPNDNEKIIVSSEELDKGMPFSFFKEELVQKNSISRLTGKTRDGGGLYSASENFYEDNAGLFFLLSCSDNSIGKLKAAMRLMADTGICGDKTSGKGQLNLVGIHKLEKSVTGLKTEGKGPARFVSLSRFYPGTTASLGGTDPVSYKIVNIRPKSQLGGSNPWKASVRLFTEGSIFTASERRDFYGTCPIVKKTAGKEIIEYGLAYPAFFTNTKEISEE